MYIVFIPCVTELRTIDSSRRCSVFSQRYEKSLFSQCIAQTMLEDRFRNDSKVHRTTIDHLYRENGFFNCFASCSDLVKDRLFILLSAFFFSPFPFFFLIFRCSRFILFHVLFSFDRCTTKCAGLQERRHMEYRHEWCNLVSRRTKKRSHARLSGFRSSRAL